LIWLCKVTYLQINKQHIVLTESVPPTLQNIQNIIFDLGGVILNIDYKLATQELRKFSSFQKDVEFSQKQQSELFDAYEKGEISSAEFRQLLREHYRINATDDQIDEAWNAMLLDFPQERIDLLQALGSKYRLFLLSNTNDIHMQRFNQIVNESFSIPSLDSLFEQVYYSHLIGMRKPDYIVFETILNQNALKAEETLFIDDSIQHIESAQKLGIKTLHLAPPLTINQALQHGAL